MAGGLREHRVRSVVVCALVVLAITAWMRPWSAEERPAAEAAPYEYTHPTWSEALKSSAGLDETSVAQIRGAATGFAEHDAERVRALAEHVLLADLTGTGRERFQGYWPPGGSSSAPCTSAEVLASSAALLPTRGGEHAKALLVWEGECTEDEHDHGDEEHARQVGYVYATKTDGHWVPVREWEVPRSGSQDVRVAAAPLPAELDELVNCDGEPSGEQARLVVVEAWRQLCAAAAEAGVELDVTSGVRTAQEQALLYEESEEDAGRVAPSDGRTCDSKHCDGTALDAEGAGVQWLHEVVGCVRGEEVTLLETECGNDPAVKRLNRYGFSSPDPTNRGHLEFTLPTGNQHVANCGPSRAVSTPEMVAQIFRCRLGREGLDPTTTAGAVAEALVVSRCESLWNPRAMALNGKFRTEPHPLTGETVTEAGVFMLGDRLGKWAPAGEDRLDPVENINAAASIWLANRDWNVWPCATGAPGPAGTTGPVLPQHGGPDLPEWALQY